MLLKSAGSDGMGGGEGYNLKSLHPGTCLYNGVFQRKPQLFRTQSYLIHMPYMQMLTMAKCR